MSINCIKVYLLKIFEVDRLSLRNFNVRKVKIKIS